MFCPSCGRNNPDNIAFCQYCGKALPQNNQSSSNVSNVYANPLVNAQSQKERLSFKTKKAIATVAILAVFVLVVLLVFYPNALPWNW